MSAEFKTIKHLDVLFSFNLELLNSLVGTSEFEGIAQRCQLILDAKRRLMDITDKYLEVTSGLKFDDPWFRGESYLPMEHGGEVYHIYSRRNGGFVVKMSEGICREFETSFEFLNYLHNRDLELNDY